MKATELQTIDALKKRVDGDPDDLEGVLELVRRYNSEGMLDEALALCRAMMKTHSRAYSFLLEFANVLFNRGEYREARVIFRKLTEFKPERVEAWYNMGILELAGENLDAAQRAFGKTLELEPRNDGALCNMGNCFAERGDAAMAATYFERALEVRPRFPEAWYNLGNAYMSLNHFKEAKDAFEKAIKHDKNFGSAYKNLGFVCEQLEEYEKALERYVKAASLNRSDAGVQINMAGIYMRFGQFDKALECGKRAVSLAPANTLSWNALSLAATHLGDGETYYRAAVATINSIGDVDLANSISDLRCMGFELEAEELLEYAVKLDKKSGMMDALPFAESAAPRIKPESESVKVIRKNENNNKHKKEGAV